MLTSLDRAAVLPMSPTFVPVMAHVQAIGVLRADTDGSRVQQLA